MAPIVVGPNRITLDRVSQVGFSSIGFIPFIVVTGEFWESMHLFDVAHQSLVIGFDEMIVKPLNLKCHGSLEKVRKYNAWYARQVDFNESYRCRDCSKNKIGTLSIVEPIVFLGADHVISHAAESDVVKKGLECLPEHLRAFAAENSQFVLVAGAARVASAIAVEGTDGLNRSNAARFGKAAIIQVGADALGRYIINPAVEQMVGAEESTTKTAVSWAANYGALLTINYLTNR